MLETIRQYARDRLLEAGCSQAGARPPPGLLCPSQRRRPNRTCAARAMVEWLERLDQELDNLRVALEWSLASNVELGLTDRRRPDVVLVDPRSVQ